MIPQSNYTMIPNVVIEAMPTFSGSQLKTILAICRSTIGYHRDTCRLTTAELMNLTGLSKQGAITAASKLVEDGWIQRDRIDGIFCYELSIDRGSKNLTGAAAEGVKKFDRGGQKIGPEGVKKFDPSTNKGFKERSIKKAQPVENFAADEEASSHFENDSQRQEQNGEPQKHQHAIAVRAQVESKPPAPTASEMQQFVDTYNKGRPSTWAAAILHPGRSPMLRAFASSVGGFAPAQQLLKLALGQLHLNPDFYVKPSQNGQQLRQRNLDWLMKSPKCGGVPYLLQFAEAGQTAGIDADALIDAVAAGVDIQAARKQFEYVVSGQADEDAQRAAEAEQAERDRDDELARAWQLENARRRAQRGAA